jgi:hypothetical protein
VLRDDDSISRAIAQPILANLVVIDDVGSRPSPPARSEALFRLIDAASRKRSIATSSNVHHRLSRS